MSTKELNQVSVLEKVLHEGLSQHKAADLIGISERHLRRKRKRYEQEGVAGLAHKGRGRTSNRRLCDKLRLQLITLAQHQYIDYGPTLMAEYVRKDHGIRVDHETLRKLLIEHGVHRVKKRRYKKDHIWRERKYHEGELVQMDGSLHQWFGDEYTTLMLCIDDATGKIYGQFAPESVQGVAATVAGYFRKYGRPIALYVDRGSVYKINNGDGQTQFQRMMKQCDVKVLHARSPQAKGRVERAFRTLQKRLCIELKRRSVSTVDHANRVLKEFIPHYNRKFAVKPVKKTTLFRSLKNINLSQIMRYQYTRTIHNGRLVKFRNKTLLVDKYHQPHLVKVGAQITAHEAFDGTIHLSQKGANIRFTDITYKQPDRDSHEQETYTDLRPWQVSVRNRTFLSSLKPDISK